MILDVMPTDERIHTEKFSAADVLAPRSVLVANRVLWIGKNYRGKNAATIDLERTHIEITLDQSWARILPLEIN